jgi:O-antigen biosynthesis protein
VRQQAGREAADRRRGDDRFRRGAPIKWIGCRSYGGRFVMGQKDILPVCIKAGALDDNVPKRDLWISPHHAMYFEDAMYFEHAMYFEDEARGGVLIEARDLLNGVSIVQAERIEKVEYFHIELDTHDVIVAEGALSETFIDDDSRGMFHNAQEYDTLYADEVERVVCYCAPRYDEGYEVEAVRQRLALRAGLLRASDAPRLGALRGYVDMVTGTCVAGWAQNSDAPEAPL